MDSASISAAMRNSLRRRVLVLCDDADSVAELVKMAYKLGIATLK